MSSRGLRRVLFVSAILVVAGGSFYWESFRRRTGTAHTSSTNTNLARVDDRTVYAAYGGSKSCEQCHQQEFALWQTSHHAQAEREPDLAKDGDAFRVLQNTKIGFDHLRTISTSNHYSIVTDSAAEKSESQEIGRIIGVLPLWQMLIPAPGGKVQASEAAYHPQAKEWFDVYGAENRRPGEWGHWTGRGMNWNSMCAACHNTRLRKNYLQESDTYQTARAEMGVGCEACHGPLAEHSQWQQTHLKLKGDPHVHPVSREKMFSVCGSCHSRRQELTGDFVPGEDFFDHYALTIPDQTETFYADGQIHDEDYELTSFLGSRMHAAGVRCTDCHEPHTSKLRLEGNALCLSCHGLPAPPAPKIEPKSHSRHSAGSPGDQCVNCHMPQTTYMQKHGRHDHGFTVPDAVMTLELGIPNACGKCHADKGLPWTIEHLKDWPSYAHEAEKRTRSRMVAAARVSDTGFPKLIEWSRTESNAFWGAVATGLLRPWSDQTKVSASLISRLDDTNALVRLAVIRAAEPSTAMDLAVANALQHLLNDPMRAVRVEAAWALRRELDTNSTAGRDLLLMFAQNADQPSGAMQNAVFSLDRNDWSSAEKWFLRGVGWDTNSAALHEAFGVGLSMQGETGRAVAELKTACRLEPRNAELRYKLGLALNEARDTAGAQASLEEAVKLEPRFARAWYNLGLAYNAGGQSDKAIEALLRAESLDLASAEIPYARATILQGLGRIAEARVTVRRVLELSPNYPSAKLLLDILER